MGENYLGVPGWLWGASLGTAALYGAYQLAKGPDTPKTQGKLEPESKPWLYKMNPSYWFKSKREKKFVGIEKERGVRNLELEKELGAAQRAYAVHQAAAEKAGKVERLEKEMTTSLGDSFIGAKLDSKDVRALDALKKARLTLEPGITWSPEQLKLASEVVGSVLGGREGQAWLKEFLAKNAISWADEAGVIYTFNQGRVVRTPSISMSMTSKESVLGDELPTAGPAVGDEIGFSWKTGLAAGLLTAGIAPAAYLAYKGGKAIYNKIKGKKKSPEEQRQARMAAAYQRKAAALKSTRAMEKRHLAALAVKESERDIAEAEAQALESEAALQTAQAIALEAEATKDVPEIAEDLSGWAVMGGCPWMAPGPAHVAATNSVAGATLRRGLAAARATRTSPEAREILMGIAVRAKKGDVKARQLIDTMKAGVGAERQLLATHESNLAARENIVRKNWARVAQLKGKAKSRVSGTSEEFIEFTAANKLPVEFLWNLFKDPSKGGPYRASAFVKSTEVSPTKPRDSGVLDFTEWMSSEIRRRYGWITPQIIYIGFAEALPMMKKMHPDKHVMVSVYDDAKNKKKWGRDLADVTTDYMIAAHANIRLLCRKGYGATGVTGATCGAAAKGRVVPSSEIPSSIPGEPPDVQVAIAAAAESMGVPPAVAGSVIAAAHAGDKNAKRGLDQAEAVYRAAQKGDPVAKQAMAAVVADAKSGYAPAAQKAAVMAAAVGTLKGRALWQDRKAKEGKKNALAKKEQTLTGREYRILSIKLSRYLVGTGPLCPSEAARGLALARGMKLGPEGEGRWARAFCALDRPTRRFLTVGTGLGMFRSSKIAV
jgi:hypothetical protein